MVLNYSTKFAGDLSDIIREIEEHNSLRETLAWAATKPKTDVHSQVVTEMITQDEFTHDVIVPYRDLFLAYDTT